MEKEDQIIKELIKEGFLKSAPDGFTEKVMQAVAKTRETQKPAFDFSFMGYSLAVGASILVSVGVILFYKPSFFQYTFGFFGNILKQVYYSFSGLFSGSFNWELGFELNSMILGVVLIMVALLVFDNLLSRKRKVMNVFV